MKSFEHEAAAIKQARKRKDFATVETLKARMLGPEVEPGQALYINAYFALETERLYEGGPIPWSSIVRYAAAYDFTRRQTEDLVDYIRRIDNHVLKEQRANAKKAGAGTNQPTAYSRRNAGSGNHRKAPGAGAN